jgi:uncharacterized Zn-binding protein involved in type VI secretion
MPPAARVGDMHVCPMVTPGTPPVPHVGGPILPPGCPMVLIGGMPAARVTDMCVCVGPPDVIAKGSPTVLIGNLMAARMGDLTAHGGTITVGFPTVMIGEVGMGSPPAPGAPGAPAAPAAPAAPGAPGTSPGGGGGGAAGANGPYATADEAARAALQAANPQSIAENREFSGLIYQGADGQYYYTGPARGTATGANPYRDAPAPPGTTVVGDYHTHGDYSELDDAGNVVRTSDPARDDFNSDNFSDDDKTGIAADGAGTPGYAGYLGTPSGTFRRYDPATDSDTVL